MINGVTVSEFRKRVQELLTHPLPEPGKLIAEGHDIAEGLALGRSLFCEKMDVRSEVEYKSRCVQDGIIMYHAHIGLGSWAATADALRHIHLVAQENRYQIDRAGICLDRRMAVPDQFRQGIPAETGPMLSTMADWDAVGQTVAIQPHMGDFMIGFPSAVANTVNALRSGVTTVGNLSQYFSHEAPMWNDPITTAAETVRAISILGRRSDDGLMLHSYLEDGYGALFQDCTTIAGWAYLERYIVEKLLGARLTHCIGGLTSDPLKRVGWVFALQDIHEGNLLGSMFYGDTISFTQNITRNLGVVGEYLLWDILAQLECPTGHAVHPLPITEAIRVPTAQEIAEVHTYGRQIEAAARRMHPFIDFAPAKDLAQRLVQAGLLVFNNALDGLRDAGVDVKNPLQILYVLKQLGPSLFEAMFGLGEFERGAIKRKPLIPSDIHQQTMHTIEDNLAYFTTEKFKSIARRRRLLLASTDVHEHALFVLNELLLQAGAEIINLGAEKNPVDIAEFAAGRRVDAILISTHNGMALEYAQRLKHELHERQVQVPVLMGGVLNQKMDGESLPVDVRADILRLGFQINDRLDSGWGRLLPPGDV